MEIEPGFDKSYEWKAILLLGLGFGLVGLDRWIIAPLLPAMAKDLHLDYKDMGYIVGVLAFFWGVFAIILGRLSDAIGRRKVLIPAMLIFSLMCGLTGLASGFLSLLAIRAVMGLTEGAYCATSVAAAGEASHPKRRGFNQGLQMSLFSLFGLGLGPILATSLLGILPSWRWVFFLAAIPGLVVVFFMVRVLREPKMPAPAEARTKTNWLPALLSRNVIVGMMAMFCGMSCIFVLGALLPSYLTDYPHISEQKMGVLMSALGIGGFVGDILICAASDFIGRRTTLIVSFAFGAASLYLLTLVKSDFWQIYALLFLISAFSFGILTMMTGPVASEAVPPILIATATGLISGAGEIFGGGIAPALGGLVAQGYGIQYVLYVGLAGLTLGVFVSFFLKETAPRIRERKPTPQT